MKLRAVKAVPVRFQHASPDSRAEGWGRWSLLGPSRAELLTRFRLEKGDRLVVFFEVFGERFDNLRAMISSVTRDADGYYAATLELEGPMTQLRLGRLLRDALSRT